MTLEEQRKLLCADGDIERDCDHVAEEALRADVQGHPHDGPEHLYQKPNSRRPPQPGEVNKNLGRRINFLIAKQKGDFK